MTRLATWKTILVLVASSAAGTLAETDDANAVNAATNEQRTIRLKIRQARLDLARAEAEMDRAEVELGVTTGLFQKKIVTVDELKKAEQEFGQAKLAYRQAQIDLHMTKLKFLTNATLVTVVDAKKSRSEDSRIVAIVTLRNDSNLGKARTAMETDAELLDKHQETSVTEEQIEALLDISNVTVTLVGKVTRTVRVGLGDESRPRSSIEEGIVGDPFQQTIALLRFGETKELTYELIKKDVEAVTVRVEYQGVKKEYRVFLKKEATQDLPSITSTQYAQQGKLGTKIKYDLVLESLGKTDRSFRLVTLNLPPQIPFKFVDPETNASLAQITFTEEIAKRRLNMEVSIPEKLDQEMVDQHIEFDVFVVRPQELKAINELRRKYEGPQLPAEALTTIKGNRQNFVLIPTGAGKLDILITNLFKEVRLGDPVDFRFTILNSGTLALRAVTPELDPPLEWEARVEPQSAPLIEPGQKAVFKVDVETPTNVVVGEYIIKIEAEGSSGVETVDGISKNFTVRIAARRNIGGTLTLVFVLIALVVILAVATVKISRR